MKHKKLKDERIEKESEKLGSIMYLFMISLLIISLTWKIISAISFNRYFIEILCLTISIPYLIFSLNKYNIGLFKKYDDIMKGIRRSILSKCGTICFWIIIIGEFLFLYLGFLKTIDISLYLISWGVPAFIITIYSIKKGLLIWGGPKRKASGKNSLAKRTFIGALFFGLIMGGPNLYHSGTFHANGILWIIEMALGWGIPFYFIFKFMINLGEKNADKQVENIEGEADYYEKQTNEDCPNRK